jgi:hypothetical protein
MRRRERGRSKECDDRDNGNGDTRANLEHCPIPRGCHTGRAANKLDCTGELGRPTSPTLTQPVPPYRRNDEHVRSTVERHLLVATGASPKSHRYPGGANALFAQASEKLSMNTTPSAGCVELMPCKTFTS